MTATTYREAWILAEAALMNLRWFTPETQDERDTALAAEFLLTTAHQQRDRIRAGCRPKHEDDEGQRTGRWHTTTTTTTRTQR